MIHEGQIPGFSWRIVQNETKGPFVYDSHSHYDLEHKPYLLEVAERVKALQVPIVISFFEPNVLPEPTDEYADLFRYVVSVFREAGAYNAVFSMYLSAQFPFTITSITDYYPGHEWIDMYGISIYDLYLESPQDFNHWLPGNIGPVERAWPWVRPALEITDKKTPVVISELGSGRKNAHNNARWMLEFMQFCQVIGISDITLFNVDFGQNYTGNIPQTIQKILQHKISSGAINWTERDWTINENPERLQAYAEIFSQYPELFLTYDTLEERAEHLASFVHRELDIL